MKVTIAFADDELYRAVRVRAAQSGRQIREIVEQALEQWLSAQEDAEDVAASVDALAEYGTGGGVDADAYFARLVAEGRVRYPDG
jgi:plasmid stability protein